MFIPYINTPRSTYLFRHGPLLSDYFKGYDIAVVQRQVSEQNHMAMARIREQGLKIVYDLDDNIWALPEYNPAKQVFDRNLDGFRKCAELAHILTVSTIGLATAAKTGFRLNKEIFVIPNSIDFNMYRKKDIKRYDERVVIGWGGSNTHSEDVSQAFEVICDVLDNSPSAYMEIVGSPATDTRLETIVVQGKKKQRKVFIPSKISKHVKTNFKVWVPVGEYPNRMCSWGWDISVAPLQDNRFNRSKSNLKMLEAAVMKIPCLVSDVQPYNEFCSLGGDDLRWLLCRTDRDWKNKLTVLVNEPERREHIGNLMYDVAFKFFNIDNVKNNWNYVFSQAMLCQ
jgi:glycosyltransferase involved in cell wall biosynthesis